MHSRKDFLRKLGASITAVAVTPFAAASGLQYMNDDELDDVQKDFLETYEKWLSSFHKMIKGQKKQVNNPENDKILMALSKEAEGWKKQLEVHMLDERFAAYHAQITRSITNDIA